MKALREEIDNLTDAIAGGALKSSPALASRLAKAEQELTRLEAAQPAPKATQMIPRIADEYRAWVADLEAVLSPKGIADRLVSDRDIARARAQLKRRLGGHIIVRETESEIRFETEAGAEEMALRMAGMDHMSLARHSLQNIPETWFTHFGIWGAPRCPGKSVNRWMNASDS